MEDMQTGDVLGSEGLLLSMSPVTCQAVVVELEDAKVGDVHGERVGQGPRHVAVLSVDGVQLGHAAIAAPPWKRACSRSHSCQLEQTPISSRSGAQTGCPR